MPRFADTFEQELKKRLAAESLDAGNPLSVPIPTQPLPTDLDEGLTDAQQTNPFGAPPGSLVINQQVSDKDDPGTAIFGSLETAPRLLPGPIGSPNINPPDGNIVTDTSDRDNRLLNSVKFENNVLNSFENATYHFKFFMTDPLATRDLLQFEKQVVIAETGSSSFFITDVKMNSIISPTETGRNSFISKIQLSIIEPQGNTLFDRIRAASLEVGAENHLKAPYWLELSFRGYTGPGEQSWTGGEVSSNINNETRLWQVSIQQTDVQITKGGTEYTFHMIQSEHVAWRDASRRIEKTESIQITTLGELFDGLKKNLENYNNYKVAFSSINGRSTRFDAKILNRIRKYEFILPDNIPGIASGTNMKNWQIRSLSQDNITELKRAGGMTISKGNSVTPGTSRVTFNQDTEVESIILEAISATSEGQALAIFGNIQDPTDEGNIFTRKHDVPAVIFMVDTIVKYEKYNVDAKDYDINIEYHIRPYKTFVPIVSRQQILDIYGDVGKSEERLIKLFKISKLKKKYDYIYTGLNTDVLDFEIHVNQAWYITLPFFQAQNRSQAGVTAGDETKYIKKQGLKVIQDANGNRVALSNPIDLDNDIISGFGGVLPTSELRSSLENLTSQVTRTETLREVLAVSGNLQTPFGSATTALAAQQIIENITSNEFNSAGIARNVVLSGAKIAIDTSPFGFVSRTLVSDPVELVPNTVFGGNVVLQRKVENLTNQVTNIRKGKISNPSDLGSISFIEDLEFIPIGEDQRNKDNSKDIMIVGSELAESIGQELANVEPTVSKGRSFFKQVMQQMFDLNDRLSKIRLEIRGDPYWLGEPDPQKRIDTSNGSIVVSSTIESTSDRDLTSSDSIFILTMGFPENNDDFTLANDLKNTGQAQDNLGSNEFGHAGTGLVNVRRTANGFNGVYQVSEVISTFSNGKFTQILVAFLDELTREIDVLKSIR